MYDYPDRHVKHMRMSSTGDADDKPLPDSAWLHPVLELSVVRKNVEAFKEETVAMLLARVCGQGIIPSTWNVGPGKRRKGIQVFWGDVQNSEWPAMKTVGKVQASVDTCARILADIKMGPRLDKFTRTGSVVHTFDDTTDLRYFETHGFMIIDPRDFCVVTTTKRLPDGRIAIASRSITSADEFGRKTGYSRAHALLTGYLLIPHASDPAKCDAIVYAHVDFGGTFPSGLIKLFGLSAPIKIFEQLQKMAAEDPTVAPATST
ncbi:hypothetical protein DYB32_003406 [Aphanomyces invadans]|uniref:START domain-containing protein n=1 Tax=Aphanomyces invadans TaxID=157072 RepID=A0A3R6VNZ5_9STRA|nr:hypothetical protein DYB32_003406 [Aphanomyces invadans]